MKNENSANFVRFLLLISIRKTDLSKYQDIVRMGTQIAGLEGLEGLSATLKHESNGYDEGKVPAYRMIQGVPIKLSVDKILRTIERYRGDMEAIVCTGGKFLRLRDLKYLLSGLETHVWDEIRPVLTTAEMESIGMSMPSISKEMLDQLPDNMKDFFGSM